LNNKEYCRKRVLIGGRKKMIEVTVTVNYKERNYQTNVIVNKEMTWEKIKRLAEEQIKKQWNI
jgi:hypothetical protein